MPFAMIAGSRFGNYKGGFRFGRLGYELVEKRGLTRYQARTYYYNETSILAKLPGAVKRQEDR
jgi:hypothetical protein